MIIEKDVGNGKNVEGDQQQILQEGTGDNNSNNDDAIPVLPLQPSVRETSEQALKRRAERLEAREAGVGAFHCHVDRDWLTPNFPGSSSPSRTEESTAQAVADNDETHDVESHIESQIPPIASFDHHNTIEDEKGELEELIKRQKWAEFIFFIALIAAILFIIITVVEPGKRIKSARKGRDNIFVGTVQDSFPTIAPTTMIRHCIYDTFKREEPEQIARTVRYVALRTVLEIELEGGNPSVFNTPCAPHDLALTWLADKDPRQLMHEEDTSLFQRFAASLFYFSTNMRFNDLPVESPWLSREHECLWFGITCRNSSTRVNIIDAIYLPNLQLAGSIPNQLDTLMPFLPNVNLAVNKLGGSIDEMHWTSSTLEILRLADNNLHGTIPESMGSLIRLGEAYLELLP
eukprot:scaffold122791_cov33-Attheya_sp.AAC.4